MSARPTRGPVVIDTIVFGADLVPRARLAPIYEIIVGRPAFISFQTAAELRYGALRLDWRDAHMPKLAMINEAEIVHSGAGLVLTHARLRVDCERVGHALHQRDHDADRWVAATAVRLGIPSFRTRVFENVPGLPVETAPKP